MFKLLKFIVRAEVNHLIDIVGHTTWLQQLPTLVVSIASLLALGALARWWGLSRVSTLLIVSVLAGSRIAVEFSTHLKPYSHDLLMASLLLFTAAKASRERNVWWFAGACVVSVTTSLTALPLVVGDAVIGDRRFDDVDRCAAPPAVAELAQRAVGALDRFLVARGLAVAALRCALYQHAGR